MANIATLLARILSTRYGNEMRQDLHDSIKAVNDDTETALGKKLTFTTNTRKLKLLAKDDTVLSEVLIPGGGSGGGSVDSVNGLFPDENGNVELNLDDINDVDITSVSDGDALVYDAESHKWVNGAGGGGTTDYTDLTNKPSVNGVTLSGNKTSADLGISGGSNENLLLNPWFNVNTKGFASANSLTTGNTTVDKWEIYGSTSSSDDVTVSKIADGIRFHIGSTVLSSYMLLIAQRVNYSLNNGDTITFSFIVNGELKQVTGTIDSSSDYPIYRDAYTLSNGAKLKFMVDRALGYWQARIGLDSQSVTNVNVDFKSLKLELGSASTLALDVAPNTNEETVRCNGVMRSNRNLLDNPWFTVNQKGFTSGTVSQTGETVPFIDRWSGQWFRPGASASAYTYTSNGLQLNTVAHASGYEFARQGLNQIKESIADILEKQVTFSIKLSNGEIKHTTFTISSSDYTNSPRIYLSENNDYSCCIRITPSTNSLLVFFDNYSETNKGVVIRAVKLELGTESTLALDVAPSYTEELLKCQRYYYPLGNSGMHIGRVYQSSLGENMSDVTIILPTAMRTTPTYNNALLGNDFSGHSSNLTNIEVEGVQNIIIRGLWGTTPTYGVGYVQFGYSNQPAYLSAEL